MTEKYLNIRNGLLFPFQFQILGYVLLFAGIALTVINIWASIVLILVGGLIVTAYSGIEFKGNQFRKFNAFFFLKSGKWQTLDIVDKLFIKKINISQKYYGRANQSSTLRTAIYKVFLKFASGKTVLVYENKDKNKLEGKVKELSHYLNTELEDYSN